MFAWGNCVLVEANGTGTNGSTRDHYRALRALNSLQHYPSLDSSYPAQIPSRVIMVGQV